ncbi:NAD(P)H dehydrogenase (quinone) [Pseudomonas flavescens]|uniref:NAD(P)H dehydrogenase (Quinone) n=1 Tax=Phytopseudomonas flavescens TaxID=29435 RepID=A0A1G7YTY8_9GAMM|nr:NAD(P)H-binding protein [Pseudomonas flavescens]SDG99847.1 NAD(P)H dehydrogenase (quinone) [Pseudomonas flavescens]
MPNPPPSRLFVTGASGQLGRRVVEHLLDSGATGIVAGSRTPDALAGLTTRGVELRRADFDDCASLDSAFAGIDHLLIISVLDTPDDPPRRLRRHLAAVAAAAKAGVKHITYTSMQAPGPDSPIPFAPDHRCTEEAIEATGIAHTILRPNWYTDIAFFWLPPVLASRQWFSAAEDGRVAYLWRDDLARAAAASLLAGGAHSRTLDISGPEALSPQEIIATVNEVFGTSAQVVPVSDAQRATGLRAAGLPEAQVAIFGAFDVNTRLGRVDTVNGEFKRLTGRKPRSLREFLLEHRDALLAASKPGAA